MKNELRGAMRVVEPAAAKAMTDPKLRRIVLGLVHQPRAMSEMTAEFGLDIKQLHRIVTRLHRLGLVEVALVQPRAGRPIKHYRASASAFFVPHEAAAELPSEGLSSEMRQLLRSAAHRSGDGSLFTVDDEGRPQMQSIFEGGASPPAAERWYVLRLDAKSAAALRQDVEAVLDRYCECHGERGQTYLVHFAVAKRSAHSVSVDNRRPRPRKQAGA